MIDLLLLYCSDTNVDDLILKNLKLIDWNASIDPIRDELEHLLINVGENPKAINFINSAAGENIQA